MSTDEPMPLVAHLRELRDRFRNALIAVFVAFLGLFPFANELYTYVSAPLRSLRRHAGHTGSAMGFHRTRSV